MFISYVRLLLSWGAEEFLILIFSLVNFTYFVITFTCFIILFINFDYSGIFSILLRILFNLLKCICGFFSAYFDHFAYIFLLILLKTETNFIHLKNIHTYSSSGRNPTGFLSILINK